jgi:hypothetical protein
VVASLMLMHRIEAKPSSAPDICATRPRSVQRRVRQQLAPSVVALRSDDRFTLQADKGRLDWHERKASCTNFSR